MNRRTALGLLALTAPGLAGCTLLGLNDPPPPMQPQTSSSDGGGVPGEGAPSPAQPEVDDATVEPLVAKGRVTYADGRPLEGASVLANNTLGYNSYLKAQTDADGRYRIEIPDTFITTWTMWGTVDIEYHGQVYNRELDYSYDGFATGDGSVCDMTLKLSGTMTQYGPDPNHHHGDRVHFMVDLEPEDAGYVEQEDIEVTMVPTGPLLDGSTGGTIVSRIQSSEILDIPVGEYEFSVAYHAPDGAVVPLQVRVDYEESEMSDSVTAVLPADGELLIMYLVPGEYDTSG